MKGFDLLSVYVRVLDPVILALTQKKAALADGDVLILKWICCLRDMRKNHMFSKSVFTVCGSYKVEPVCTSFFLITTGTSWNDV